MNRLWKVICGWFADDGSYGKAQVAHLRRLIIIYWRKH